MVKELKSTVHNLSLYFTAHTSPADLNTQFMAHLGADRVANPARCWITATHVPTFASGAALLAAVEAMPHDAYGGLFLRKVRDYGLLFKSSDIPDLWTFVTMADFRAMCADIDAQLAKLRTPPAPTEDVVPPGIYYACFTKCPERYKSTLTQTEVMDLLRSGQLHYVFDGATQQSEWAWSGWLEDRVRKTPAGIRPFKCYANIEAGQFFHVVEN